MKTIAQRLDEAGYKYRGGKRFCKSTISRMLANEKYTGVYNHKTEGAYTNIYPRIIPEELFREVQAITEANKKGKHVEDVVYLLKMKMKCGYCGGTMVSDSGTGRDGRIFRYYSCGHKKRKEAVCHKKAVRKEAIEKLIVDATIDGLATSGPLVKRLRHRPFTAKTWVRFPYGSPSENNTKHCCSPTNKKRNYESGSVFCISFVLERISIT